jgi:hypothetical protein
MYYRTGGFSIDIWKPRASVRLVCCSQHRTLDGTNWSLWTIYLVELANESKLSRDSRCVYPSFFSAFPAPPLILEEEKRTQRRPIRRLSSIFVELRHAGEQCTAFWGDDEVVIGTYTKLLVLTDTGTHRELAARTAMTDGRTPSEPIYGRESSSIKIDTVYPNWVGMSKYTRRLG